MSTWEEIANSVGFGVGADADDILEALWNQGAEIETEVPTVQETHDRYAAAIAYEKRVLEVGADPDLFTWCYEYDQPYNQGSLFESEHHCSGGAVTELEGQLALRKAVNSDRVIELTRQAEALGYEVYTCVVEDEWDDDEPYLWYVDARLKTNQ